MSEPLVIKDKYGRKWSTMQSYTGRWHVHVTRRYGRGYTVGPRRGYATQLDAERALSSMFDL